MALVRRRARCGVLDLENFWPDAKVSIVRAETLSQKCKRAAGSRVAADRAAAMHDAGIMFLWVQEMRRGN